MRREIRYAFVSYAFILDILICVTCSSPYPTSRSFPERICRPTLSKTNLTTVLHPCVALVSAVVLGGDGNNLLSKEERRISASFEVYVLSLPLFVVCY